MASDPMYPNQGDNLVAADLEAWSPAAPAERTEKERQELLEIASSAKVIKDVVEWFKKQAEHYSSIDAIQANDTSKADDVKVALLVAQKMRSEFKQQARDFEQLYDAVLKHKEAESQ